MLIYTRHYSMSKRVIKHTQQFVVKQTQTIRWQWPTNCLSVFDHFVGLAL